MELKTTKRLFWWFEPDRAWLSVSGSPEAIILLSERLRSAPLFEIVRLGEEVSGAEPLPPSIQERNISANKRGGFIPAKPSDRFAYGDPAEIVVTKAVPE